jgi:hypothetical protein
MAFRANFVGAVAYKHSIGVFRFGGLPEDVNGLEVTGTVSGTPRVPFGTIANGANGGRPYTPSPLTSLLAIVIGEHSDPARADPKGTRRFATVTAEFQRTLFREARDAMHRQPLLTARHDRRRGTNLRPLRRFEFVEIVTTNTTPPSGDRNSFAALWTALQGPDRSEKPQENAENCGCCGQSAVEALLCFQHVAERGDF